MAGGCRGTHLPCRENKALRFLTRRPPPQPRPQTGLFSRSPCSVTTGIYCVPTGTGTACSPGPLLESGQGRRQCKGGHSPAMSPSVQGLWGAHRRKSSAGPGEIREGFLEEVTCELRSEGGLCISICSLKHALPASL